MKAYRFWQVREALCGRPDDIPYHLYAWGGSNRDRDEAGVAADMRMSWLKEKIQFTSGPLKDAELYGYGTAVIREEWLELVAGSEDAPEAVITRNRYGAPVLNARSLAMIDIDFPDTADRGLAFWKKAVDPAEKALLKLREWHQHNPRTSLRVYRTPKGLRVLRTDEPVAADTPEAERLLQELGNDPLYAALCKRQQCFRARLGPKPWRIPLPMPPHRFPREGRQQAEFEAWLESYQQLGSLYAACTFIEWLGEESIAYELEPVVSAHVLQSRALEGMPIA